MKNFLALCSIALIVVFVSCTQNVEPQKVVLFNGTDLSNWTLFIPGDSVNVNDVWSVKDSVVHCVGVPSGYMRTKESYSNYKLHLEWRWVQEATNSGVLLHCTGEDKLWPICIECQLMAGNAGDFVLINPGQITVDDSTFINTEQFLIIPKKHDSNEKPVGEWNTYDIECRGNAISCYVNGVMQNNGVDASLTSGPIALQSEGSDIEFKNIYLTLLDNVE